MCVAIGACSKRDDSSSVSFYGAVLGWDDSSIYVMPSKEDSELNSNNLIVIPRGDIDAIHRGMVLKVEYDGLILETYPSRIENIISVNVYENQDIEFDRDSYTDAYQAYMRMLINPDYPCGEEALDDFLKDVSQGEPSKYATYRTTIEGDPMIFYYEYVVDDKIGNYIIEGYDSSYDLFSANPGISYYKYPYIFYDEKYDKICVGECVDMDAYDSVINYDSDIGSYVYLNDITDGKLTEVITYEDSIPVLRINEAANATIGIDTINNPNVITLNNQGIVTAIKLDGVDGFLAKGVYFNTDKSFVVVCESNNSDEDYLIKEFSFGEGKVTEEKSYFSKELPWD